MTHEIQLAQAAGLSGIGYDSPIGPLHSHRPTGFKKIHHLLRGRYPLAITLAVVCAILGAAIGYFSLKPTYRSDALIEIKPTVLRTDASAEGAGWPDYSTFVRTQMAVLLSRDMISRAMDRSQWTALNRPKGSDGIEKFSSNLEASQDPGSSLIRVSFTDHDAQAAQIGATVITTAYEEWFKHQDPLEIKTRLGVLDDKRTRLGIELQGNLSALAQLSQNYGTDDLSQYLQENLRELGQLNNGHAETSMQYAQAKMAYLQLVEGDNAATKPSDKPAPPPLSAEAIGRVDPAMKGLIQQQTNLQNYQTTLSRNGILPGNPLWKNCLIQLDLQAKQIQDYADSYNREYRVHPGVVAGQPGVSASASSVTQALLDQMQLKMDLLQKQIDSKMASCQQIGKQVQQITQQKLEIDKKRHDLDQIQQNYDQLDSQRRLMDKQIDIVTYGEMPIRPIFDQRVRVACVAFIGGALLPIMILLIIGLADSRYRYSDEPSADMAGIPLLGILPDLPDLLTDPQQAATAAHCVHRIRTLLQIAGQSTDRRVFAVTSGSAGDGKTSLSLALGLSFAASGSRTLLIDADMVGAGLTARLNVNSATGILEAMTSRQIMEFVHATDVADLSVLPVGQTLGSYAGGISPIAVRRMINEARNHFDAIIVDTGPILGSIEASPVAAAADAVILCVSCGQHRPLVDRALAQLQGVGAHLAGVVFNRAKARDFERSISRQSFSSTPDGGRSRADEGQYGPIAKAVASSVRAGSSTTQPGDGWAIDISRS